MTRTPAAAFASDPPLSFLVPDAARREALLRVRFGASIPLYARLGAAWVSEDRCEAERTPAYLNAGSPRGRDLYLRHGFGVIAELRLPFGGPWRMWRAPA